MARVSILWDRLRTSLWFVPTAMTMLAAGFAVLMIRIDRGQTPLNVDSIDWIYAGGPDGARQMLSTIAGSMITVAGVAFSITIVALTLASQQFGPRLLRNFMRDVGNQVVLGTYISTFIYCLLVLRTIHDTDSASFVPHLSVTGAVVLAIVSFGVLIYFIHHVSSSIQAATLVDAVAVELRHAIDRLFPGRIGQDSPDDVVHNTVPAAAGDIVHVDATGYIQMLDGDKLLRIASEYDLVITLLVRPGNYVVDGDPLAQLQKSGAIVSGLRRKITDAVIVGPQRTSKQDAEFAVNQLVEIAVRALSPGVNDPFTAVNCIDQLSAALCRLAERRPPMPVRSDDDGVPRLYSQSVTFVDVTRTAFDQIRQHSRSEVAVSMRLLEALARIAGHSRTDADARELLRQAQSVIDGLDDSIIEEDRRMILDRHSAVTTAVDEAKRSPRSLLQH